MIVSVLAVMAPRLVVALSLIVTAAAAALLLVVLTATWPKLAAFVVTGLVVLAAPNVTAWPEVLTFTFPVTAEASAH